MFARYFPILAVCALAVFPNFSAKADYQDVIDFFNDLNDSTTFPVQGGTLSDLESAFGPRVQTSGGNYDWHRGIDIDGTLNTDLIVAPLDGYLHRYQFESASSGYTVILRHELSDFGVPSLTYEGKTITRFYTWYSHLYDDGIDGNAVGTGDQYMDAYSIGDAIPQNTIIGILGDSGTPANGGTYGPHLHFELRVGSNASLQFQLDNPMTTQWGFDPHINPMILFDPQTFDPAAAAAYTQALNQAGEAAFGEDLTFDYNINVDELPLLNRIEIRIIDTLDAGEEKLHVLDFNLRSGYNAETTAALDTLDTGNPYVDPVAFGDDATQFESSLVVPGAWLAGYEDPRYEVEIRAFDIYGNEATETVALIPEPSSVGLVLAGLGVASLAGRKR